MIKFSQRTLTKINETKSIAEFNDKFDDLSAEGTEEFQFFTEIVRATCRYLEKYFEEIIFRNGFVFVVNPDSALSPRYADAEFFNDTDYLRAIHSIIPSIVFCSPEFISHRASLELFVEFSLVRSVAPRENDIYRV